MTQALYTSKTGLTAGQYQIDVVANNIANINTTAYKAASVNFQTLFSDTITQGSTPTATNGGINPKQIGLGVQIGSIKRNFDSGTFISTGLTSDMMISGNGYFAVMDANGNTYLTRDGSFTLDANGDLVNSCTYRVLGASGIYSTTNSQTNVHIPTVLNTETVATPSATFNSKDLSALNNASISKGTFDIEITLDGNKYHSTVEIANDSCNVTKLVDQINQSMATARVYDSEGNDVTTALGVGYIASYVKCNSTDGQISFDITDYANTKENLVIDGTWFTAREFYEDIAGGRNTYYLDEATNTIYSVDENDRATQLSAVGGYTGGQWTEPNKTTISCQNATSTNIAVGTTTNLIEAYEYQTAEGETFYVDKNATDGNYNVYQLVSGTLYTKVGTTDTVPTHVVNDECQFNKIHTLEMEGSTRNVNLGGTLISNTDVYQDKNGTKFYLDTNQNLWYSGDDTTGFTQMYPQPSEGQLAGFIHTMDVTNIAFASGSSNFLSETGIATNAVNTDFTEVHGVNSKILDYTVNINDVGSLTDAVALEDYTISSNGIIEASYSNGDMVTVHINDEDGSFTWKYTTSDNVIVTGSDVNMAESVAVPANMVVQLATLVNEAGLVSESNNLWTIGPNAGTVFYGVGGTMGLGSIQASGLEGSNVDMSTEFSNMIIAQRAIQANSRVFSAASSILETLVYMGQ